jgi:hypothetical protein
MPKITAQGKTIDCKDGSVDIYMGPDAPTGKEKNWIPTVPGKAWFPYFRLYSPKKAFLCYATMG